MTCGTCRGDGKIVAPSDGRDPGKLVKVVCPLCFGTGKRPVLVRDPFSGKDPGR